MVTPRRRHTAGDARYSSPDRHSAYRYFDSPRSFSGFRAVAHSANAPQSHHCRSVPYPFRLSDDLRCSARGERCILGAGCRADYCTFGRDLASRSLRADGETLLFRRATICLGRSSNRYCRGYIVDCCVRPMRLAHKHLTNGPTSKCVQRVCHDPLSWLISFSLGLRKRSSSFIRDRR
jgi:hypothetical protein